MDGERINIQVTDNGPGIPLKDQEKVFQPFFRSAHGHRIVQGMGLGLSIARDIVTAHGGEIILESTPGRGSSFKIRI
jgi:signal transduction histidine kinase